MANIVQFKLETAPNVFTDVAVEVRDAAVGQQQIGRAGDVVEQATMTFNQVLGQLTSLSSSLMNALREVAPDKVDVEFGVKLSATSGVIVASGTGEAAFKITLKWERKKD